MRRVMWLASQIRWICGKQSTVHASSTYYVVGAENGGPKWILLIIILIAEAVTTAEWRLMSLDGRKIHDQIFHRRYKEGF